jgi:hypothetical protein
LAKSEGLTFPPARAVCACTNSEWRINMVGLRLMSAAAIFFSLAWVQASAEGGCGFGFHRGPNGSCRMNPGITVAPAEIYHAPVARPPVVAPTPVGRSPEVCGVGTRWNSLSRRCEAR